MRYALNTLCQEFILNRDTIKATFGWEHPYLYSICASIFTDKRKKANENTMIECKKILKKQVGVFSNFRGNCNLVMISMMSIENQPEQKLKDVLNAYTELKKRFNNSEFLPLSAIIIANSAKEQEYDKIAYKTRRVYELMKKEHPFLTSGEDSVFATLLSLSDLTEEQIVSETEQCYNLLKSEFSSRNAVQSLSHVLALGEGSPADKSQRTINLFNRLKNSGYRYGTNYELSTLGVLAMIQENIDTLVRDIIEVDKFLSTQKGYGIFGIDKKQRLMHAGMLVTSDYIDDQNKSTMDSASISATMSLIAAQQAAMIAVITASSAAAASAN